MADDRENFDTCFVRPLESHPRDECGFIILNTAFPLLERYLKAAVSDRTLNDKLWSAPRDVFQQLHSWREAKDFLDTYRNGLLHHGTFNSSTHRGSVVHPLECDYHPASIYKHVMPWGRRLHPMCAGDESSMTFRPIAEGHHWLSNWL